jgi:hypothetical protein
VRNITTSILMFIVLVALTTGIDVFKAPLANAINTARGFSASAHRLGNGYVFWKGTDGNLWEGYWNAYTRSWHGPQKTGMGPLDSERTVGVSPLQASGGPGGNAFSGQYVYWRGTGASHDLWMARWNGSWHGLLKPGWARSGRHTASPTSPDDYSGPHAAYHDGKGLSPFAFLMDRRPNCIVMHRPGNRLTVSSSGYCAEITLWKHASNIYTFTDANGYCIRANSSDMVKVVSSGERVQLSRVNQVRFFELANYT